MGIKSETDGCGELVRDHCPLRRDAFGSWHFALSFCGAKRECIGESSILLIVRKLLEEQK